MNAYRFAIPRAVIGFAAVAMTAVTLAISVVVPAALASPRDDSPAALAGTNASDSDRAAASNDRMRIDVVGVRAQATAFAPAPRTLPKQSKQEG